MVNSDDKRLIKFAEEEKGERNRHWVGEEEEELDKKEFDEQAKLFILHNYSCKFILVTVRNCITRTRCCIADRSNFITGLD